MDERFDEALVGSFSVHDVPAPRWTEGARPEFGWNVRGNPTLNFGSAIFFLLSAEVFIFAYSHVCIKSWDSEVCVS